MNKKRHRHNPDNKKCLKSGHTSRRFLRLKDDLKIYVAILDCVIWEDSI